MENMVAFHLFKLCHFLSDTQGYRIDLYFLRDVDVKRDNVRLISADRFLSSLI
jgi:hypothetical protein